LIVGRQWTANDDIYVKKLTDNYEKGRVLESGGVDPRPSNEK